MQISIIDYTIVSENVHVDGTDIKSSDIILLWMNI